MPSLTGHEERLACTVLHTREVLKHSCLPLAASSLRMAIHSFISAYTISKGRESKDWHSNDVSSDPATDTHLGPQSKWGHKKVCDLSNDSFWAASDEMKVELGI